MSEQDPVAGKAPKGAHLDFAGEMSYGDYLALDQLLAAQRPLSQNHNELLFIVQHQTTELWMKLVLHELDAARDHIRRDALQPAFKMLARVSRVMGQLIQAWDVLATLTPSEYMDFRHRLGKSSGFQSHQYRMIEFTLGNKNAAMAAPFRHAPAVHAAVEAALAAPSLYDEAVRLLARRGFALDPACVARDWRLPYAANASVEAAWTAVYRDTAQHWDLYELAEELVDLEDYFRQWRFRHVTTVERIIGFKTGTGGTEGVQYLRRMLAVRLFPELWDLRTSL
ncbi:MAG: tryptophan 2,3-dioxygenase [Alphaproteobacteria bacterium]|nr:tryptophan 2,3-dioxygenase [Alphaproteobacteria bacterium]